MATIATHNGSKVCREHNVRNSKVTSKEAHIDPNGVHETWHDEKIRSAYKRLFGDAQEAYNDRQTREDRKIHDYYKHVAKDGKKHVAYEMIAGVYGKDVPADVGKEILREFVAGWKERNPSLELIGAYYHADEQGDPHVHIDYIPVGHGYARGMETQTGLNKALGEMGFETISSTKTAQIQWERRENLHLEALCKARNLRVERPKEASREHLSTEQYKAAQELTKAQRDVKALTAQKNAIQKELETLKEAKGPIGRTGPLKQEIADLQRENADLERDIKILCAEISDKDLKIDVLNSEIERQKELQPSIEAEIERAGALSVRENLQRENNRLRQILEQILNYLKEHAPEIYRVVSQLFDRDRTR